MSIEARAIELLVAHQNAARNSTNGFADPGKEKGGTAGTGRPHTEENRMTLHTTIEGERQRTVTNGITPDAGFISVEASNETQWLEACIWEASKLGVTTAVVDLTPELAQALLERNPDNRSVSSETVLQFASDITEGRWMFNGETLIVSREGLLNDGQTRCHAVVLAGLPIKTLIVFGVEREARMTTDMGNARSPGHFLGMLGIKDSNATAAAARLVYLWQKFQDVRAFPGRMPTKLQIVQIVNDDPDLLDSMAIVNQKRGPLFGGRSLFAFCHWLFSKTDEAAATTFFDKLLKGDNLPGIDPVFKLRERLLRERRPWPPARCSRSWRHAELECVQCQDCEQQP